MAIRIASCIALFLNNIGQEACCKVLFITGSGRFKGAGPIMQTEF